MDWWVWLALSAVLLFLEIATPTIFFFLFLAGGAAVVGLVLLLGLEFPLWTQMLVFSVFSLACMVVFRRRLRLRLSAHGREAIDIDPVVGQMGVVVEDLPPGGLGKVELRGSFWTARNEGNTVLSTGSRCRVTAVDGLTIRVRPDVG